VGYVELTPQIYDLAKKHFAERKVGTAFGSGAPQAMSTDSTVVASPWDGTAFCTPPASTGQVYVGGFYRGQNSSASSASLTVTTPATLSNGIGGTNWTGGAYDPETGFLKTGGGFRCLQDVLQGPLSVSINSDDPGSCLAGKGIRWDAADVSPLLSSFQFKCTGAAGEALKTVVTDGNTIVMTADFYRQGDGNEESFTAKMFVSTEDEAPDLPGTQNVWIQGVGCGDAIVNFN